MQSSDISNSFYIISNSRDYNFTVIEDSSDEESSSEEDFTFIPSKENFTFMSEEDFTIIENSPEHNPLAEPATSTFLQDLYQTGILRLQETIRSQTVSSIIPHEEIPTKYKRSVKKLIESPSKRIGSQQIYDFICKMKKSKNINIKWEALMEALFVNISIDQRRPSCLIQDYIDSKNGLLDKNIIFIPFIFTGNSYLSSFYNSAHIVLITIDKANKAIEYYDSLAYDIEYWFCYNNFSMKEDLETVKNICFKNDPEAKIITNSLKQQYDCHSCGIHVLNYIKDRLEGRSFEEITNQRMSSQEIQRIRVELACFLSEPETLS